MSKARMLKALLGAIFFSFALSALPQFAFADTYHTVSPGESLWKIAGIYGVTVQKIKDLNSLDSSLIQPGQSLLVQKDGETGESPGPVAVSRGTGRVETILEYARSLAGTPYAYGGRSPKGFDCSGYLQYVFKNFGIDLPRTAGEQYNAGRKISEGEARPGDIVAFATGSYITHSGIYLGGGKFISATSTSGVEVTSVHGYYWGEHLYGFSRIIP